VTTPSDHANATAQLLIERLGGRVAYVVTSDRVHIGLGSTPRWKLGPEGLCGDRAEHPAHLHESASLGRFWCTADQSQREPWRSERRRAGQVAPSPVRHAGADGECPDYGSVLDPCPPGCASGTCVAAGQR
jgi:hypothetical protein